MFVIGNYIHGDHQLCCLIHFDAVCLSHSRYLYTMFFAWRLYICRIFCKRLDRYYFAFFHFYIVSHDPNVCQRRYHCLNYSPMNDLNIGRCHASSYFQLCGTPKESHICRLPQSLKDWSHYREIWVMCLIPCELWCWIKCSSKKSIYCVVHVRSFQCLRNSLAANQ